MDLSDAASNKLFVFVHIPKTGGSTLWHIINKQYGANEFWSFNENADYQKMIENADKMKCLIGHFPFGVHQQIKRPCTYFTMLRNPVERVISYYYYLARTNPDIIKEIDFEEFLQSPLIQGEISNTQTLFIAGGKSPDLQKAKENLKNNFAVPGVMEMFNESLFFIKKECVWDINDYQMVNMRINRSTEIPISENVLDIVKRKNELDLELHLYARQLLEEKIQQLDLNLKKELNEFMAQLNQP